MANLKFNRLDVVRYGSGGSGLRKITVLGSVIDLKGVWHYVILPEGEEVPEVYEAAAFEKHYKLVPKYEEGAVYLSADYSKAFLYKEGVMHRLFSRPEIDRGRTNGKTGFDVNPSSYESMYGPLVKWVASRG